MLSDLKTTQLYEISASIRRLTLEALENAGSGHTGGSLGMADIFASLYFHILKHNSSMPYDPTRDRLVLSNGHICPVLYSTLCLAGYFEREEMFTLRRYGTRLQGHPHRLSLPGLETSSGPLGEGVSQAIGMALAINIDKGQERVYVVSSDGEHQEGNTWEAVMFAGNRKLTNLINIIDRNYIQIDGPTEKVMPLEPLRSKYEAFNWRVLECNGNDIEQFVATVEEAKVMTDKPVCIIAHTSPGTPVSFMQNDYTWHGKSPNFAQAQSAIREITEEESELASIDK